MEKEVHELQNRYVQAQNKRAKLSDEMSSMSMEFCSRDVSENLLSVWTSGNVRTILLPGMSKDEKIVLFSDRDGCETTVEYLAVIGNEEAVVGRFKPEPGMNYVRLKQLFKGFPTYYRVRQASGDDELVSGRYALWGA